jgi:hypothetical protein
MNNKWKEGLISDIEAVQDAMMGVAHVLHHVAERACENKLPHLVHMIVDKEFRLFRLEKEIIQLLEQIKPNR